MRSSRYATLQAIGPEHEFSIIDDGLRPLPISDKVLRQLHGRIVNNVSIGKVKLGKELQSHVLEFRPMLPFESMKVFEETMCEAVLRTWNFLENTFNAKMMGLGMHPFLKLQEASVWSHKDKRIYDALNRLFNLRQHGWLNIQSFQMNLSYQNERDAVKMHNSLRVILPCLVAISASSPIYESKVGEFLDNRLFFYFTSQSSLPSITGDIVPEPMRCFDHYKRTVNQKYLRDLRVAGAPRFLMKEWINSRGVIVRFTRRSLEVRLLDEQESIKADVGLACFVRAAVRGLLNQQQYVSQQTLVHNLWSAMKDGLNARFVPGDTSAKKTCSELYKTAYENAAEEEKRYLPIALDRITNGNLAERILRNLRGYCSKHGFDEALNRIFRSVAECLRENRIYQ